MTTDMARGTRKFSILLRWALLPLVLLILIVSIQIGVKSRGGTGQATVNRAVVQAEESRSMLTEARPVNQGATTAHNELPPDDYALHSLLIRSAACSKLIEAELKQFAHNSHGYRFLAGLQQKLFLDDYAYAALISTDIDPNKAEEVFRSLTNRFKHGESTLASSAPVESAGAHGQSLNVDVSKLMQNHYSALLENPNPEYKAVWNLVRQFDSRADSSDLLKDSLVYVGLRSELEGWVTREKYEHEKVLAELSSNISDQERLKLAMDGYRELNSAAMAEFLKVAGAIENIFTFRATAFHGLNGNELIVRLNELTLTGAGPGLGIPHR